MRFAHPDGSTVHLSYCSNVHPAETTDGIIDQIHRFTGPIRSELGAHRIGVGLWIPATPAHNFLNDVKALNQLKNALATEQAEVVTLNGFPYGGFHDPVVKYNVYRPDWSEPERFKYTLDCACLLAELMPDDVTEGSISTLPFAWPGAGSLIDGKNALKRLAQELERLAEKTGKIIRIAVEPEPGCIVENTTQLINALGDVSVEWIGACLDACHMAVQFENPAESIAKLQQNNLRVVKSQVSSALRVKDANASRDRLTPFVEPRFLHQTREISGNTVMGVDDLPDALNGSLPGNNEWRVHFHIPIAIEGDEATQPFLQNVLAELVGGTSAITHHLDIETYTWLSLPDSLRPTDDAGLIRGISSEIAWARDELISLKLKEI